MRHIAMPKPLLYNRKTVAHLLGISPRSVAYLIEKGVLPFRRIGARVLYPAEAVRKLAERGTGEITA